MPLYIYFYSLIFHICLFTDQTSESLFIMQAEGNHLLIFLMIFYLTYGFIFHKSVGIKFYNNCIYLLLYVHFYIFVLKTSLRMFYDIDMSKKIINTRIAMIILPIKDCMWL